jgi:hypothetical protein
MDIDKGLGCFADLKLDILCLNPDTPDERIFPIADIVAYPDNP